MVGSNLWFTEMNYLVSIIALSIAFCSVSAAAESPYISKKYRSDYVYYKPTDAFYKLHTEAAFPNRASVVCEGEGTKLIAIESDEDLRQLHAMFKQFPDLGDLLLVAGDGAGHEEVDSDEIPMIHLEDDQRNAGMQRCEVVNRKGELENYPCYPALPFVCRVSAKDAPYNEECDVYSKDYVSKISVTGSCYRIAQIQANWNEAYANCQAEGGHLAILNNEGEFEIVKQLLLQTPRNVETWQFFVGIRAEKTVPVVYRTVFNQTLEEVGYQPWDDGEPNNEFGVEYCVSLLRSTGKYNDTVCRNRYSYVCEKERRT